MPVAGWALIAVGSVGVWAAVGMEIWKKEPIYMVAMKVFPWVIGVGGVLVGLS